MKKKEVPKPVYRWIASIGALLGLFVGGLIMFLIPSPFKFHVWFASLVVNLALLYWVERRNKNLLRAWGIIDREEDK